MAREIDRAELLELLDAGQVTLLDAQGPGWFEREHLPGAIRGRLDDPESTIAELGNATDGEIVVYCSSETCRGSALAASLLEGRGYTNVVRYTAGKADWVGAGLPIEGSEIVRLHT
jgi:rhodanese-related sulfurtransferase